MKYKKNTVLSFLILTIIVIFVALMAYVNNSHPQKILPMDSIESMENREANEISDNLDENSIVSSLYDDIVGFRFDGMIDCDLDGDGEMERVTFYTGGNNIDLERGWDLGAHTIIKEKTHQIWFNSIGSVKSAAIFTFYDNRQGVLVVVYGNIGDMLYLLSFEEGELSVQLLLGTT